MFSLLFNEPFHGSEINPKDPIITQYINPILLIQVPHNPGRLGDPPRQMMRYIDSQAYLLNLISIEPFLQEQLHHRRIHKAVDRSLIARRVLLEQHKHWVLEVSFEDFHAGDEEVFAEVGGVGVWLDEFDVLEGEQVGEGARWGGYLQESGGGLALVLEGFECGELVDEVVGFFA